MRIRNGTIVDFEWGQCNATAIAKWGRKEAISGKDNIMSTITYVNIGRIVDAGVDTTFENILEQQHRPWRAWSYAT